ncbi:hypothetical protein EMPS_03717 [Entomortierella parvispora]|uniref:F-box domain-containing protein n=1 Tax=Entomortierella parvispora TaxID=205924 RepID=A0A9P3H7B1_9FUNG|nr:hypothetical protein EMPS_03717 [Entomortierella parvispora]
MARSPLNIPEIALHISLYLARDDYANCCLVCRDWNNIFGDLLYRKVEVFPFNRFWKNPSSESLISYGRSIRDLQFSGLIPLTLYSIPSCTRIEKLSVVSNWHDEWRLRFTAQMDHKSHSSSEDTASDLSLEEIQWKKLENEFWTPEFPDLVYIAIVDLMKQSAQCLHTVHLYNQSQLPVEFWTMIAETPLIRTLHVSRCHVQPSHMRAFWRACTTQIKTLVLHFSNLGIPLPNPSVRRVTAMFNVDHALDPLLACFPVNVLFKNMENLTLESLPTLSIETQVQMAIQCPSLRAFRWRPADKSPPVSVELQRWMAHYKACRFLESVDMNCTGTTDEALAAVLDGIAPATTLIMAWSSFGKDATMSLMCHHSETIRILHLYNCLEVTSLMILDILASCPALEQFMGDNILASDMVPKSALMNKNGEDEEQREKEKEEDWDTCEMEDWDTCEVEDLSRDFNNLWASDPSKDKDVEDVDSEDFGFMEGGTRNWVCLGIKTLKITFCLTPAEELQRKHDREQYFVLRQLTRLKKLEQLEMYPRQETFPVDGGGTMAGLDLRLRSRGGQLEALGKRLPDLKMLNLVICGEEDWSEQEVDWITRLSGLLWGCS